MIIHLGSSIKCIDSKAWVALRRKVPEFQSFGPSEIGENQFKTPQVDVLYCCRQNTTDIYFSDKYFQM